MFVRKKKNNSGSISVQIISKVGRVNKLVKTVGSSKNKDEIELLYNEAVKLIQKLTQQPLLDLFPEVNNDENIFDKFVKDISTNSIVCVGPELILGKIFDSIGFSNILSDELFKHLVITRLINLYKSLSKPLSLILSRISFISIDVRSALLDKYSIGSFLLSDFNSS